MLRAIILALVLAVGMGLMIPLLSDNAEAISTVVDSRQSAKEARAKKYRKYYLAKYRNTKLFLPNQKEETVSKQTAENEAPSGAARKGRSKAAKRSTVAKKRSSAAKAKKTTAKRRSTRGYTINKAKYTRKLKKSAKPRKKTYVAKRKPSNRRKTVAKKRYSKKWWASYRAKKAQRKLVQKREREIRLRTMRMAKSNTVFAKPMPVVNNPAVFMNKDTTWYQQTVNTPATANNQFTFTSAPTGFEVLGPAIGETTSAFNNSTIGGVSVTALRRTVINEMIRDSGWVENDFEKNIGGKKVYVVVAKAPDKNNVVKSRTFYFTESGGKIYKLATKASETEEQQVEKNSEMAIEALQNSDSVPKRAETEAQNIEKRSEPATNAKTKEGVRPQTAKN
ncbi:MAG: hypothetical protein ACK5NT_05525 [Pyrinomonadaceae bacterium]